MKRRILAVIVLFKIRLDESVTFQSLLRAAEEVPADALDLGVLVRDNTPGAVPPAALPANVRYLADGQNSGLASAYNQALQAALEEGFEWLLTLDQDTELPLDTFSRLLDAIAIAEECREIGAIVPQVRDGARIVSPHFFAAGALPRYLPPGFKGVPRQATYAFNSGSLLRVQALRQIGGYSPWFWLDASDQALYRKLSDYGKRVYVAGDIELAHDFSMRNLRERVSPERYRSMLSAESAFWDLHMNGIAGLERTSRLIVRLGKHLLRKDPAELRRLTLQQFGRRLFLSRKQRLKVWRKETAERVGPALQEPVFATRLKISVCMAAYMGERHIEAQLRTVLPQLGPQDEVVIVEDASTDRTADIILAMQRKAAEDAASPRILLTRHRTNRGVIRTFEEAIRSATGDVLFLCDDDDLWAPDKVEKVMNVFAAEPETRVVCTGLTLIDDQDQPLPDGEYLRYRQFKTGLLANLLHNQYQGSAMAFRASLLPHILPFPTDRLFLHDAWIGARNTLTGGRTTYIDEPLLLYRRHAGNYSRRFSRWKQLRLRLEFMGAHLRQALPRM